MNIIGGISFATLVTLALVGALCRAPPSCSTACGRRTSGASLATTGRDRSPRADGVAEPLRILYASGACARTSVRKERVMGTILLVILILLLLGALPMWPYSSGWGYYPSGGFGLLVVILIILLVMGRL
jgi:uncharacterized protein DUF3309